jgi:hypothetical protein
MAGISRSTLHHHFRGLTAMSPLQFQKQLRLHTARQKMLTEELDAASAAFAVGYESPSQFNRAYKRSACPCDRENRSRCHVRGLMVCKAMTPRRLVPVGQRSRSATTLTRCPNSPIGRPGSGASQDGHRLLPKDVRTSYRMYRFEVGTMDRDAPSSPGNENGETQTFEHVAQSAADDGARHRRSLPGRIGNIASSA